ncbi:MAG: hypothetical protein AB7T06_24565 [Kofleriaceae bacterium]
MRLRSLALALALLGALAGCGPKILWSGHTDDRARRVEIVKDGDESYVVIDGTRSRAYRGIAVGSLVFAGSHVAFAHRAGDRWAVSLDGTPGPTFDSIGEIALSASGHIAYAAERAGAWHVVRDGVVGAAVTSVLARTLQLAGDRVVYVAQRANATHVVVDDAFGPAFDGVQQLVTSPSHIAYIGRRGDEMVVVRDGVESRAWSSIDRLALAGPRIAYAATDGDLWRVVTDAATFAPVDKVHGIWIRDDGAHVAWLASIGSTRTLALDAIPLVVSPTLRETAIAFRPTRAGTADVGLAYAERAADGDHIVLDGVAGPAFDEVRVPVWNAAGRMAYTARRGRTWFVVYNGLEHGHAEWVSDPVLADDGTLAYVRRDRRRTQVVVDRMAYPFDFVFEDTLVVASRTRWAIAAGDVARKAVYIAVGTRRVPVPSIELYASAVNGNPSDELKRWTRRELGL